MFAALVRAILGPRFTDRIIAVNMINTMVVAIICILSVYLKEEFLVDVALVYALLSFLTVTVLARMVIVRHQRRHPKKKEEAESHGA
ncbi:MAG: monovalent cation/H+ antiporter complex subunit F [Oscillibacter sp.]|nr:monovalent cation/H+ antiporter complex subunit F [Oscillibacter sp.]